MITSIFEPSEAIHRFAALSDYKLIVVADLKTPLDWVCNGAKLISIEDQKGMSYMLVHTLPYNHYCRKMIGYLDAIAHGADVIVDTDDDNIPKETWQFPEFDGIYESVVAPPGCINIYQLFTKKKIWPRGLPLNLINHDFKLRDSLLSCNTCIGVWQGLADEDPDVDAVFRLTDDTPTFFDSRDPVVLPNGVVTPFNSQNTIFRKECFPLLYLPTYVTFRFTDILRGLVAQPIMWAAGFQLGFLNATVVQKRNPHNYMRDFESEIPMYLRGDEVIGIVQGVISAKCTISENLRLAYTALEDKGIVEKRELISLDAWLYDIEEIMSFTHRQL